MKVPETYKKLEEFVYSSKRKNFRRNNHTWYLKECENCGEEFFGEKKSKFCSISCSNSCRENPNKGKKIHSEESRKKMSESRKGKNNPFYGKHHSEELINRYKERWKGDNNPNWKGGLKKEEGVYYDTYALKINWMEEVRRSKDNQNILEVKCTYCGRWFVPSYNEMLVRISSVERNNNDSRFYCSEGCKKECPIYRQRKYPKGYKKATSREVQPELRQLVLKRDNYTCQKCGNIEHLHCHHILPVSTNPIESADVDNCITYCKGCHKEVHQKDGCKYNEMKC